MIRKRFKKLFCRDRLYCLTPDFLIKDKEKKLEAIENVLYNGCPIIQLREKDMPNDELFEFGKEVKSLARKYHSFFIVNDSIELAKKLNADGVHLGQSDDPVIEARKILKNKIIGLSITTYEEFLNSKDYDIDYIGVGPIFPTKTKKVEQYVSMDLLKKIIKEKNVPIAVIGGIDFDNMEELLKYDIDMFCMISALYK